MGFLSGIGEKIFGGTDNSAQKEQIAANERTQEFIEQQAGIARGDALGLFPYGDQARNDSYNLALSMLGQAIPEQMRVFQQGNVGAQLNMAAAMPQFQNAILGLPVNNSAIQGYQIQPDTSMFQTQLPNFGPTPVQQQPQPQQPQPRINPRLAPGINSLIGGIF